MSTGKEKNHRLRVINKEVQATNRVINKEVQANNRAKGLVINK